MDKIIRTIERIRMIPGAQVDCGLGQGRDTYLAYIHGQSSEVLDIPLMPDDWYITGFQQDLAEVHTWVAPGDLPSDYAFFLEYISGLEIDRDFYNLNVYGIGLMTEEWYSSVIGDEGLYEGGFLKIGALIFQEWEGSHVGFFLDVIGSIQKGSVISVSGEVLKSWGVLTILDDPHAYPDRWTKLADSFTEWLERLAETNGSFGYL